jgi:hypothetical protein
VAAEETFQRRMLSSWRALGWAKKLKIYNNNKKKQKISQVYWMADYLFIIYSYLFILNNLFQPLFHTNFHNSYNYTQLFIPQIIFYHGYP